MEEPTNWWSAAATPQDPEPEPKRTRSSFEPFALLVTAAVLGGAVAIGGAAVVGAFDDGTSTTVVEQQAVAPASQSPAPAATGKALTVNEIYRRSGPGVVQITTTIGASAIQESSSALGSGFVLDKQ